VALPVADDVVDEVCLPLRMERPLDPLRVGSAVAFREVEAHHAPEVLVDRQAERIPGAIADGRDRRAPQVDSAALASASRSGRDEDGLALDRPLVEHAEHRRQFGREPRRPAQGQRQPVGSVELARRPQRQDLLVLAVAHDERVIGGRPHAAPRLRPDLDHLANVVAAGEHRHRQVLRLGLARHPRQHLEILAGHGLRVTAVHLGPQVLEPQQPCLPAHAREHRLARREARAAEADAGLEELRADAVVQPMPRATSTTSAPVSSQTFAISLMNEIFVARKAFDASLTISADLTSVRTIGVSSGA